MPIKDRKPMELKTRGALWIVWGNFDRRILNRSVESFKKHHPDLGTHIAELPDDSTLLDKAKMFGLSPFEETVFLDADTVVLGDLTFGFTQASIHGLACCICEAPHARRYGEAKLGVDAIEYNSGVVFWSSRNRRFDQGFFNLWKEIAGSMDSRIRFVSDGKDLTMQVNDQASFSAAISEQSSPPFVLPMNWNLRPEWQKSWFGPLKIWHDYREVPQSVLDFNEQQSNPEAIIEYFPGFQWPTIEVSSTPVRLNIGDVEVEGYTKVGLNTEVPDGSVDEVIADHVLQRFSHRKTLDVLRSWAKALKPGGLLKVSVPDHDKLIQLYQAQQHVTELESWWLGSQENEDQTNRAFFTEQALRNGLLLSGLTGISRWKGESGKSTSEIALNLQGRRPKAVKIEGVHAFMSVPRYGATATHDAITVSLIQLGIPLRSGSGAFWHESLTNVIEDVIENPACHFKYILTLDYDTMLQPGNVIELYRLMEEHPEADAICGTQMRRGHEAPLLVIGDKDGNFDPNPDPDIFKGELTPALSAHFGCTMIRASTMKKLSRPWFQAQPATNGSWRGENYIAADVHFWHKFAKQGFKLFQANTVSIAHLEEVLFHASPDMKRITQDLNDYRAYGLPLSVGR